MKSDAFFVFAPVEICRFREVMKYLGDSRNQMYCVV